MKTETFKYDIYTLRQLPPGMFGETYVVVTGVEIAENEYIGEYFVLTQRPAESLNWGSVSISGKSFPKELESVDIDFAMAEAHRQAEIDLQLLVEKRAAQLEREDLAYLPYELKKCASPFVGCWMRGRYTSQLMAIKDATKCPSLARYLNLLRQVSVVSVPSLS